MRTNKPLLHYKIEMKGGREEQNPTRNMITDQTWDMGQVWDLYLKNMACQWSTTWVLLPLKIRLVYI